GRGHGVRADAVPMRWRYSCPDTVAALRLPLRALMTPLYRPAATLRPYLTHPTDDAQPRQSLLPSWAAARGHNGHIRSDTHDVSRRSSTACSSPICRRNCVTDDRAYTRVTPRNIEVSVAATTRTALNA